MQNINHKIGQIMTPLDCAMEFVLKYDIAKDWLNGASVFDPTMGEGNLLQALVQVALNQGVRLENLPINRLFGVELDGELFAKTFVKFHQIYNINLPRENFWHQDFICNFHDKKFDIILSNPPWLNFNDLPNNYKEILKSVYFDHDLIKNRRDMLMGKSRIDIAALIMQKSIQSHCKPNGKAYFFAPLSLIYNDGAQQKFREFHGNQGDYCLMEIHDFGGFSPFKGINTRCGFYYFQNNKTQIYPIKAFIKTSQDNYEIQYLNPLNKHGDALHYFHDKNVMNAIHIPKSAMPRQGLNTCGANYLYFFNKKSLHANDDYYLMSNEKIQNVPIPKKYLYPLLTKENFKAPELNEEKWVFLPYQKNGKVISMEQLAEYPLCYNFYQKHQGVLKNRKGVIIQNMIRRNHWWALLGVGKYNFQPYKIIWQAYGANEFNPQLFDGKFQANQSLQCFMAFDDYRLAKSIFNQITMPAVKRYFQSFAMNGTMSFAQPGKVKKLLTIGE